MVKYNSSGDHHKAGGEVQCNITQYLIFEMLIFVMLVYNCIQRKEVWNSKGWQQKL